eukprot:jgi/Botrbrau1/8492/Bobra.0237s0107.1
MARSKRKPAGLCRYLDGLCGGTFDRPDTHGTAQVCNRKGRYCILTLLASRCDDTNRPIVERGASSAGWPKIRRLRVCRSPMGKWDGAVIPLWVLGTKYAFAATRALVLVGGPRVPPTCSPSVAEPQLENVLSR